MNKDIYNVYLETVTPVFIGSGKEITQIDYFKEGSYIYLVDFDDLMGILEEERGMNINEFSEWLTEFIRKNLDNGRLINKEKIYTDNLKSRIVREKRYRRNIKCTNISSNKINEFIKTVSQPFIPGSSLKGSIRTCIFYYLVRELHLENDLMNLFDRLHKIPRKEIKKVTKDFEKKVFGRDAHNDFMRFLQISDFQGKNITMEILSINRIGMKKNPRQPFIYCEAVSKKNQFRGTMKITNKIVPNSVFNIGQLTSIVNNFAKNYFNHILHDFDKNLSSKAKQEMKGFLSKIANAVNNEMFLIVGAYNGWHAKTLGDICKQHERFNPRNKYELNTYKFIRASLGLGRNPITRRYGFDFPGTMSLTIDNEILGLVRLKSEEK